MTHRQLGTLKFIQTHEVGMEYVRKFNLTTFGSLFVRGWIKRNGSDVVLTDLGREVYEQYTRPEPTYRKEEGELSARVSQMLHLRLNSKGAA